MLPEAEVRLKREPARPRRLLHRVNIGDSSFNALLWVFGGAVLVVAGVIVLSLWETARPAFKALSIASFIMGRNWDPVQESFGALPFIFGTLVTSAIAIVVTVP